MKTMKKFLSMAALAMVGAVMTGCSSEDNVIDQAQTATKNNVVTQTVTVGFDERAATRALAIDYDAKTLTKTFAEGDQIAMIYQNTSNELVKATVTIAAGDISTDGKSATFTVTMTDPKGNGTLKYIYPAAMAGATDVDYTKLNSQDGTLATLASNLDLATFESTLTAASELPASASLTNKLAILALKIKNSDGTSDLTSTITGMTLSDGTNSYSITGKDADGHIYAAIQATSGANISCFATTASGNYAKSLTSKTYAADNIYNLGLKMDAATTVSPTTDQTIVNGSTLSGYLDNNVKISIADGAIVTLKDAHINNGGHWTDGDYAGITCVGSATIILEGENTVTGFNASYPGIYVPEGKTLTIMGSGKLTASSNDNGGGSGAGIGGGDGISCGNIVIKGGEITATGGANGGAGIGGASYGTCGNITISGGTVTATGGTQAAGIGGGTQGTCGTITISGGTVTATGGYDGAGIGGGTEGICGNITISGGNVDATGDGSAAGIGGGVENYACGTITITSDVTSVTATKGNYAPNSIGKGNDGKDITVTIGGTVYPSGISQSPYEYSAPPALTLNNPTVGQVIGSDGNNYAVNATLPTGVTKVAMIAYVSGTHGLAIALADEGYMDWTAAKSACEAHTPAFTGGTWKLPSQDEWKEMFFANGGDDSSYSGLNNALAAAGGNSSKLQDEYEDYWSSSKYDEDGFWYVTLDGEGDTDWKSYIKDHNFHVRACLVF